MKSIALTDNQLTESIPPELGNLTNLEKLWVDNNPLQGLPSGALTNLTLLVTARFSATELCAPPDDAFQAWLGGIDHVHGTDLVFGTEKEAVPSSFALGGNYANPFNPVTRIRYQVPRAGTVTVRVYDVLGSLVATVQQGHVPASQHEVSFDWGKLASGLYLYEVTFKGERRIGRMSLVK